MYLTAWGVIFFTLLRKSPPLAVFLENIRCREYSVGNRSQFSPPKKKGGAISFFSWGHKYLPFAISSANGRSGLSGSKYVALYL